MTRSQVEGLRSLLASMPTNPHALSELLVRIRVVLECEHWSNDSWEVARLVRWLRDRDELADDELGHVLEILSSPWKWDKEYEAMCADMGRMKVAK